MYSPPPVDLRADKARKERILVLALIKPVVRMNRVIHGRVDSIFSMAIYEGIVTPIEVRRYPVWVALWAGESRLELSHYGASPINDVGEVGAVKALYFHHAVVLSRIPQDDELSRFGNLCVPDGRA